MALSQAQISAQIPEIKQFGPINLVVIQPTSFCNLNCDYCYLPDRHLLLFTKPPPGPLIKPPR